MPDNHAKPSLEIEDFTSSMWSYFCWWTPYASIKLFSSFSPSLKSTTDRKEKCKLALKDNLEYIYTPSVQTNKLLILKNDYNLWQNFLIT